MPELLPTLQARRIADGLVDYLTTTFSLAEDQSGLALQDFLQDPENGLFKGPYARLRLPFRAADETWRDHLEWTPPFPPYRHQAQAYARLTSLGRTGPGQRPEPTLITTGTGSGKTEAFLHPILDHVLRAKRAGVTGVKAIILYPMNALADDQARRLAKTLTDDPTLASVTAAVYTGNQDGTRTTVRADGLITHRPTIRESRPDILLTNYKMLDQLLLREEDQPIWRHSARSLQYLVLDEFHTYDGAQGTDVAMLLRRLGLALKAYWPESHPEITAEERRRPLGRITPVATSATLGDEGDPTVMLDFARTVFGEEFGEDAVVTETLLSLEEWAGAAEGPALEPVRLRGLRGTTLALLAAGVAEHRADSSDVTAHVLRALHADPAAVDAALAAGEGAALDLLRRHPDVHALVEAARQAVGYPELLAALLGSAAEDGETNSQHLAALEGLLAALSHVRAQRGREALSVDLHFWVRELTRIDRVADATARFLWGDDGTWAGADDPTERVQTFPSVYCRHCGRSGWMIELGPVGDELAADDSDIRRKHVTGEGRTRALLHAPGEDDHAVSTGQPAEGLRWLDLVGRRLLSTRPDTGGEELGDAVLPVLARSDAALDRREDSGRDDCPACLGQDGIRFLGSAIATLLSVSLSVLFGDPTLDDREKKSLVFTDSVQDAAHRAGFVQSRSHTMSLRSALGGVLAADGAAVTLDELVDEVLRAAGDHPYDRFRLVPPDCERLEPFQRFWEAGTAREVKAADRRWVRRRLLFDAALEFGLQSTYGRTLEATGAAAAQVDAGPGERLATIARRVLEDDEVQQLGAAAVEPKNLTAWVRGVLEHMRLAGGIQHEWLDPYIKDDGRRYRIWGGRPKNGMPAFPAGRGAPAFPRVGPALDAKSHEQGLDTVRSAKSWYALWAVKCLQVTGQHGAKLTERLLAELARQEALVASGTDTGATAYAVPSSAVLVRAVGDEELSARRVLLACDVCRSRVPGTPELVEQLDGAPCLMARCDGRLEGAEGDPDSFYRGLYTAARVRRVVAKEHTSLLEDRDRREIEEGFKSATPGPQDPNVLVATPTLEMGIDIGNLSTVMLSSLPKAVAQYVQRVGRAGRLTGNAFTLAFVTGRGDQLPRLGNPLSLINGQVRPPATYLDAEEILRRQYLASLVDAVARGGRIALPARAQDVMKEGEGSFVAHLVSVAETEGPARLDAFLAGFAGLSEAVVAGLRAWALPGAAGEWDVHDSLSALLHRAAREWRREAEELERQKAEIETRLPQLRAEAENPNAEEERRRDLRVAEGALGRAQKRVGDLRNAHWVGALEERGVLPNYTLLDDTVTLDARITALNSETGDFEAVNTDVQRPSARALTELAPGAVFYTRELAIRVDGLDLGREGEKIRTWAWCAECGYGEDRTEASGTPGPCPRCGSTSLEDVAQRHEVVRLEHVFAEVRRERDRIDDREDQRRRVQFATVVAADLDPDHVTRTWHVGEDFGVTHHRRMDIRWLNLGQRAAGGFTDRQLAGQPLGAKPFRVCAACGRLDSTAGANSRDEHRPWCRYRDSKDEDTRQLVLSRELRTEGVVLTLPPHIVGADSYAVPSLAAALLLGLREDIGGAPDHLQVETVPQPGPGGVVDDALLLHDVVPGGTGYLADLASPERLWRILVKAYRVVEACGCADEQRRACHRCLMPFALRGRTDLLSRVTAARHLRTLLQLADGETGADLDPEQVRWHAEEGAVVVRNDESALERRFRAVFTARVQAAGGAVTEIPADGGNRLKITGLGDGLEWHLVPQVNVAGSRPDFVLRTGDPEIPETAIFADGRQFHATGRNNRIADDAAKRAALRAEGLDVIALTWDDLDADAKPATPRWLGDEARQMLFHYSPGAQGTTQATIEAAANGPLDVLIARMQNPGADEAVARRNLGERLGVLFIPGSRPVAVPAGADLAATAAALMAGAELPPQPTTGMVWRNGPLQVLSCLLPENRLETVVMLDDSPAAVEAPDHQDAWWQWLMLGNLLTRGALGVSVTARSLVDADVVVPDPETPLATDMPAVAAPETRPVPVVTGAGADEADATAEADLAAGPWADVDMEYFSPAEKALAAELAAAGIAPGDAGEEVAGLMVSFSWPAQRVAVLVEADPAAADELTAAGWTVVGADAAAVRDALGHQEENA